jgi:hypothetical protein
MKRFFFFCFGYEYFRAKIDKRAEEIEKRMEDLRNKILDSSTPLPGK